MTLVRQARAAGLALRVEGDMVVVQVLRSAEPLVEVLRQHKCDLLAPLACEEEEVAWRVQALRGRPPAHGPIIVPMVWQRLMRSGTSTRTCSLCDDLLPPDHQLRCGPCARAVEAVLNEVREGVIREP
jgi:hypothetical protein